MGFPDMNSDSRARFFRPRISCPLPYYEKGLIHFFNYLVHPQSSGYFERPNRMYVVSESGTIGPREIVDTLKATGPDRRRPLPVCCPGEWAGHPPRAGTVAA